LEIPPNHHQKQKGFNIDRYFWIGFGELLNLSFGVAIAAIVSATRFFFGGTRDEKVG
jgi:hypothetical protein